MPRFLFVALYIAFLSGWGHSQEIARIENPTVFELKMQVVGVAREAFHYIVTEGADKAVSVSLFDGNELLATDEVKLTFPFSSITEGLGEMKLAQPMIPPSGGKPLEVSILIKVNGAIVSCVLRGDYDQIRNRIRKSKKLSELIIKMCAGKWRAYVLMDE